MSFDPETYAARLTQDGVAIFLLHGVEDGIRTDVRNYTRKHIPKDDFAALLKVLKSAGTPVSMDDIVAHRQGEWELPPQAFAVTFDDGFANNREVAAPILAELDIPAMCYATSDFIDSNRMSWIDRIEWAVEQVSGGRLSLPWGTRAFEGRDGRIGILKEIRREAKSRRETDFEGLASRVQDQLGFAETWSSDHPLDRKMTWDELADFASLPGMSVGGHSHGHGILAFLDDAALAAEIDLSLSLMREKGGLKIDHYSYPEGLGHCFDERVIACLKAHGIVCSPTAIDGVNGPDVDLFHLRRVMVA